MALDDKPFLTVSRTASPEFFLYLPMTVYQEPLLRDVYPHQPVGVVSDGPFLNLMNRTTEADDEKNIAQS